MFSLTRREILTMILLSCGLMEDLDARVSLVLTPLTLGMLLENGPFVFITNKTTIKLNDFSWNKKANVLYLESPGGVHSSLCRLDSARASETTTLPMMTSPPLKTTTRL